MTGVMLHPGPRGDLLHPTGRHFAPAARAAMTIPLQTGIVYGPVSSRRLGRSLGVNLLPENRKTCTFNCPYCQYGWTTHEGAGDRLAWPDPVVVARGVETALRGDPAIDCVTLAGNGLVRNRLAPGVRIAVLSNSSTLDQPRVVAALHRVDDRYMKLDAGDDETLRRVNGVRLRMDTIIQGLQRLDRIVLQSMFVRSSGRLDNTTTAAIQSWLDAVVRIRPSAVHIYTLHRGPASRRLRAVPRSDLDSIAGAATRVGIPAFVY
jgi:wyosine [tRNA(Phe)-imidazoG37] synthetase (radical SAM superfamily)